MYLLKWFLMAAGSLCAAAAMAFYPPQDLVVDTPMVHDPVMAEENGTYYVFSTGHGISSMTSTDRQHWHVDTTGVLTGRIPAWTHDSVPGFKTHIWAPDILRWQGRWYLAYSCSTFGKNTSAIGLLSNDVLAHRSQWKDEGCIITSKAGRDQWNAIDPNFVIDEKDQPWLVFGSFWDGIQMVKLDNSLHVAKGQTPVTVARRYAVGCKDTVPNPTSKFAGPNAIEAPFIFHHDGWYYLFVSWDYCCRGTQSNYRVVVGRSRQVTGPYVDDHGRRMLDGGGKAVISGDGKVYEAAGHCAVCHTSEGDIFLCHGYSIPHHGAPLLIQRRITWKDGWPEVKVKK